MDLETATAQARREYADARPRSRDMFDRARHVQPGGNTRSVLHFDPFPFRVDAAHGCELVDIDGHHYIDLLGNYTAGLLGHDPAPVLDAVRGALDRGWSIGSVNPDEVRLAELLVDRFDSIEQVRFTNSGTEANLMALSLAVHHTGRRKVVVFANGYHGGVLTFGDEPSPVTVPHDWLVCRYNDGDAIARTFVEHGPEIAAVLVEPMQGSGGCIVAEPTFLHRLRELCDRHGSLLVFDEVMTSRFSRGGAQGLWSMRPDLTALGKYLAGGFSFGAFGGRSDVMRHFDPAAGGALGHAGTFNNNVVSMAAGIATLDDVLSDDVIERTHAAGDELRAALNETFVRNGLAMCVTGVGSLMNVHGTSGPVSSAADLVDADDRLKELFFFHCLAAGYYLARRGFIALSVEVTRRHREGFLEVADRFRPIS